MVEVQVPVNDQGHDVPAEDAEHGHPEQIIASELHKAHNILNDMSTMIHLNRSSETDQLLSKIRDAAEMLMMDSPAEDAEGAGISKDRVNKFHGKLDSLVHDTFGKRESENAENEPHGYPQGMTAIQNTLINQLKKHGFALTKISHADKDRDKYPTVFMHKKSGAMHKIAEIDGMGYINGEPYKDYIMVRGYDAEDAEGRSNAQHAAIAISLQKAGKKPA
jgi:hypothetical protein